MKQKLSLIISAIILILPVICYAVFKTTESTSINAAEGKPVVLEFSTPLCSECQKLKKVLVKVEPKYNNKISFQKINANVMDEDTITKIQKYNVRVVPTTIFINKDGQAVLKEEGAMSEEVFTQNLDKLLK